MKFPFLKLIISCSAVISISQNLYAENCTITHTIKSETVVTSPSDRTRKKLGIGEDVTLTLVGGHKATWTIAGGGKIDGGTAAVPGKISVTYTAPDDPTPTTPPTPTIVTAKCDETGGKSVNVSFTVVKPDGLSLEIHSSGVTTTLVKTTTPYFKIEYLADIYILPNDVNFGHVEIKEDTCNAVATDYFAPQNGDVHTPVNAWNPAFTHVAGKGTLTSITDHILMSAPFTPTSTPYSAPYSAGKFKWSIPQLYKINGIEKSSFITIDQTKELALVPGGIQAALTVKKAGTDPSVTANKP